MYKFFGHDKKQWLMRDSFYCSCFDPAHAITIEYQDENFVEITMIKTPYSSRWKRLWTMLKYVWYGDDWYYADVTLTREEYERMFKFMEQGNLFFRELDDEVSNDKR